MADWKMIDADGHIREVENDVFEYLPDYYKARREAVMYFPLLPGPIAAAYLMRQHALSAMEPRISPTASRKRSPVRSSRSRHTMCASV